VESLGDEEPKQDQWRVQAVIPLPTGLFQCLIEKLGWEKLAEVRSEPAEIGIRKRVEGEWRASAFASS
jgi:hypothetical protein